MGWFLLILTIVLIILFIISSKQKQNDIDNGVLLSATECIYYGGFSDIEGGKLSSITIYKDKMIIYIMKSKNNYFDGITKPFYINKIKDISIKTETQMQSEISIGKMILFGIFSLAMKDEKIKVNNYLVINYEDNEQTVSIILNTNKNEEIVNLINKLRRGEN